MITATLDLAVAEPRSNGIWDYISPSRLNLWLRCPLAFKLRYVDGVHTPPTANLFLGKQVHDALEVFYRHRHLGVSLPIEAAVQRVADHWEVAIEEQQMRFASVDAELALQQQAQDLVRLYLQNMADSDDTPLAVETRIEEPLIDPASDENLGIPLLGVMDLILDGRYGSLIVDFKTASRAAAPFEVTHEIQLGRLGLDQRADLQAVQDQIHHTQQRDPQVLAVGRVDQRLLDPRFHRQRGVVTIGHAVQVRADQILGLLPGLQLGIDGNESNVLLFDGRLPAIGDALDSGLDRQRDAQLPVTIKHLQGVMDLLAQEQVACGRRADPVDVPQFEGQRAFQPEVQAAGADVIPDAFATNLCRFRYGSRCDHVGDPFSAASKDTVPSLMAFSVSIRLLASMLLNPASGLANMRPVSVSTWRTPRPRMLRANW